MKTKTKQASKGTDFIELCELTVGKEVTKQILNSEPSSENDNFDDDDDEVTPEQLEYMRKVLAPFKK